MTRKSNSQQDGQNGAAPAQEPNAAAPVAEYKVGPGCPPKEYQFKKGQSGNPRGAKRKVPSLVPDLKKLLEQVLGRKITVPVGGQEAHAHLVYPYALRTRKSAGLMTRKLSVTESQKTAQFFGTSSRRKCRTDRQNSL